MANPKFIKSERKLATIREIAAKHPIEGADRIEMVMVDGWECVVKKDENINVGDLVVYIEIDSIVPDRPEFEFLRDRKFRVRTIKLRKQISQGLVLPLSILNGKKYKLGDDVTKELGIMKYDPEAEIEREVHIPKPKSRLGKFLMRFKWYREMRKKKFKQTAFPGWISKTDETRVQNIVRVFNELLESKSKVFVTEKLDGQSCTAYIDDKNHYGVCSRNLSVPIAGDSNYAKVFHKYNLEKVLKAIKNLYKAKRVVIQGEICGPGVQGNKYKFDELKLFIFNVIIDNVKLNYSDMEQLITERLKAAFGELLVVPLIEADYTLPATIKELVEFSKGQSVVRPEQKREGLVLRTFDYKTSFKVINPEFLLEEDDK
jgi:hypothetical protein